jgi:hypothetical protein
MAGVSHILLALPRCKFLEDLVPRFVTNKGNQEISLVPTWENGIARVAGFLPDYVFMPMISMETTEARRFAAAILDCCDRAEQTAQTLAKEQAKQ